MTVPTVSRVTLVLAVMAVVQETVMLDVTVAHVHPDVTLLVPIAAGILGGPAQGARLGFVSGLVADLFVPTPFGLSALVGTLVGYGVGLGTLTLVRTERWLAPGVALLASATGEALYAVIGSIMGQPQMIHAPLDAIVPVVSIVNAILAPFAMRLMDYALVDSSPEGVPVGGVRVRR